MAAHQDVVPAVVTRARTRAIIHSSCVLHNIEVIAPKTTAALTAASAAHEGDDHEGRREHNVTQRTISCDIACERALSRPRN